MKVFQMKGIHDIHIGDAKSITEAKAIARANSLAAFKIVFDDGNEKELEKGRFAKIPAPRDSWNFADRDLFAKALDCFDEADLHNLLNETDLRGHSQSYWDKLNSIASMEATQ